MGDGEEEGIGDYVSGGGGSKKKPARIVCASFLLL
jgi:hypothetical protein